jgi:hypothetical protein
MCCGINAHRLYCRRLGCRCTGGVACPAAAATAGATQQKRPWSIYLETVAKSQSLTGAQNKNTRAQDSATDPDLDTHYHCLKLSVLRLSSVHLVCRYTMADLVNTDINTVLEARRQQAGLEEQIGKDCLQLLTHLQSLEPGATLTVTLKEDAGEFKYSATLPAYGSITLVGNMIFTRAVGPASNPYSFLVTVQ